VEQAVEVLCSLRLPFFEIEVLFVALIHLQGVTDVESFEKTVVNFGFKLFFDVIRSIKKPPKFFNSLTIVKLKK